MREQRGFGASAQMVPRQTGNGGVSLPDILQGFTRMMRLTTPMTIRSGKSKECYPMHE